MFKKFRTWLKNLFITDDYRIAFGRTHWMINGLKVPKNLHQLPKLEFCLDHPFEAPATVDLRDYCTKTENQGSLPYCAAYTAAGWAENILWRKNDYITQINPSEIYRLAKEIDGDPNGDGTTLDSVLQVLLNKKYFDPSICKIQCFWNYAGWENTIKYAIHKFGAFLLACNITEEWYLCNPNKTSITAKKNYRSLGGHAILCCGYNRDGVIIHNSWGEDWGSYGFALITWSALKQQFLYGAVLSNCLNGMKMN